MLYNRYCVPSPACDICGGANKSLFHALCDCPKAKIIWEQHAAYFLIVDVPHDSFHELLLWIHRHTTKEEFTSICVTLWASWFYRNKQVFEGDNGDPVKLAADFIRFVADYNIYSPKVMIHHPTCIL